MTNDLFWKLRQWPKDALGYTFLGNAVMRIGKAAFPDEWTGSEPATPAPFGITQQIGPDDADRVFFSPAVRPWQKTKAYDFVRLSRPDLQWQPIETRPAGFGLNLEAITEGQWEVVKRAVHAVDRKRAAARGRFHRVQHMIADAMVTGELVSVLRGIEGGDYSPPLPRVAWNTERLDPRFHGCQMHREQWFKDGFAGDGFKFIFVAEAGLAAFCEKLAPNKATPRQRVTAQSTIIDAAVAHLWPTKRVQPGTQKGRAYEAVQKFATDQGVPPPDDKTIRERFRELNVKFG